MPKKTKLIDSGNLRNPFHTAAVKLGSGAVDSPKRKVKDVPEEINLTRTEDDSETPPIIKEEPNFNLYAGTELGMLKGIAMGGDLPISKNVYIPIPNDKAEKSPAVVGLAWTDDSEKELLACFDNHAVKSYNTKLKCFTRQILLDAEEDRKVVGLCCPSSGKYVYGLDNGTISMWSCLDAAVTLTIKSLKEGSGKDLRKVRMCPDDKNFFATGGKENDLRIWNFNSQTPEEPVYKARNVPHDFLELRQPVWIQDLAFLPRTTEVVAVATRYGQIRLYDVRAGDRPVSNIQFVDHPIMSITSTMDDRKVIVGTAQGEAGMYDLRNPGQEKLCLKYFGFTGSIRSMEACTEQPYVVSSGLDRFLYIHKFDQRDPVKKLYLKQQVNCVAISKTFMKEINKNDSKADDWANIPPEVLHIGLPPTELDSPSPPKKLKKGIRSWHRKKTLISDC